MNLVPSPAASAPPRRAVDQARLLQRLRWRQAVNAWQALHTQGVIRPLTILLCSVVVWAFVFAVAYEGFHYLRDTIRLDPSGDIVGMLLNLMFLALGGLLIFSSGLILYGSLFTSAETAFLLSRPVRADQVFAYKFQGAVGFSSWAFLLLGGPVLIAYGLVCRGPWHFYAFLPLFFLGYILLPGCLGALACLVFVNGVPRRRKEVLAGLVLLLLALVSLWIYRVLQESAAGVARGERDAFNTLIERFAFTRSPLLPSTWVARGLRLAGRGDAAGAGYYLALVWSNGLFLYLLTAAAAAGLYRRGYNRLATGGGIRRRHGGAWLDRLLESALPFVRPSTRLLIVKDFRTFRRDPQQWGQVLLFCGLMALYFLNIRRLFVRGIEWPYQNAISLLNLVAVALLLCTYTGRFIYPLLSLEGRKFWILGLLPVERDQLLWGKFAFATTGGVLISVLMVLLSDLMLEMPWPGVLLHVVTAAVLAAGLSGLSVGLGACMPNFRENDPSKIAVGFGGTLNLVVGLLFLLLTLALMAGPWHLLKAAAGTPNASLPRHGLLVWLGLLAGLSLGAAAIVFPLRAGIAALRRMEF